MGNPIRIVVVGAGYGGVLTAKKLAASIGKSGMVEITLIDKNTYHTMLTELHEVAAGRVSEKSVRLDLKTIFLGRAVTVVQDGIERIDFNQRVVISANNRYAYDYLVIGTGSKPTFFGIEGAEQYCHQLWSYDDAVKLKHHILKQFSKASNENDSEKRRGYLRFITVGCGFTGVEMVGELAEWVPRLCREYHIQPEEVEVMAVDVLPTVLPIFPENLVRKAVRRLEKMGVNILTGTGVTAVGEDFAVIANKGTYKTNTVIWTAGIEGSTLTKGLSVRTEGRGRIVTNMYLQAESHSEVYVVGDNVFALSGPENKPVPQMVENAEHSADLVAHNIAASIKGGRLKVYEPKFHGAMVCIGGKYGIAHIGLPGRFIEVSGFMAMFVKHFINMLYFFQVAGIAKCWAYFKQEFYHVPDRRSFVGGLISKATPNLWVVPLRLFLGYKWFEEGWSKLPRLLADPGDIFLIPSPVSVEAITGATQEVGGYVVNTAPVVADAVSSATQAGAAAPEVVANGSNAVEAAVQSMTQWGQALPVPDFVSVLTSKTMQLFFYTPDGGYTFLAQLFQGGMIMAEMGIGLCLMAGLFAFPASIAAIAMGIMIWASGMAPVEMLWYMCAAVATMGGSGSVLGLDYYVLPWLKTIWNRIPVVKKWYLFIE